MTTSTCSKCALFFGAIATVCCAAACKNASTRAGALPLAGPNADVSAPARSSPSEASAPRFTRDAAQQASGAPPTSETPIPQTLARDATDVVGCGGDADCVITCRSDGSCCLEQCGCSMPMSRAFLDRLEAHHARECGPNPRCPVAGCVGTKLYEARCRQGQCVAVKLPGGV